MNEVSCAQKVRTVSHFSSNEQSPSYGLNSGNSSFPELFRFLHTGLSTIFEIKLLQNQLRYSHKVLRLSYHMPNNFLRRGVISNGVTAC